MTALDAMGATLAIAGLLLTAAIFAAVYYLVMIEDRLARRARARARRARREIALRKWAIELATRGASPEPSPAAVARARRLIAFAATGDPAAPPGEDAS